MSISNDSYNVYRNSKYIATYKHFTVSTRNYFMPIDTDLGVGPFYTDTPDLAVPELERYLLEQWGRKCTVRCEVFYKDK